MKRKAAKKPMKAERQPEELTGPESLDPDRPTLEQFEEWAMAAPDQTEFDRRSEWLQKNVFQNPESVSEQMTMRVG